MSSNDYILIKERNQPNRFKVTHNEADGGRQMWVLGYADTLEEAVRLTYTDDFIPEYGLTIILLGDKP